jgi:hypothetical protein
VKVYVKSVNGVIWANFVMSFCLELFLYCHYATSFCNVVIVCPFVVVSLM